MKEYHFISRKVRSQKLESGLDSPISSRNRYGLICCSKGSDCLGPKLDVLSSADINYDILSSYVNISFNCPNNELDISIHCQSELPLVQHWWVLNLKVPCLLLSSSNKAKHSRRHVNSEMLLSDNLIIQICLWTIREKSWIIHLRLLQSICHSGIRSVTLQPDDRVDQICFGEEF